MEVNERLDVGTFGEDLIENSKWHWLKEASLCLNHKNWNKKEI